MKIINKLNRYLEDDNYQIILKKNSVNITNIEEVIDFSISKVTIRCNKKTIVIEGKNLIISKMEEDEVLIIGPVYNVRIN